MIATTSFSFARIITVTTGYHLFILLAIWDFGQSLLQTKHQTKVENVKRLSRRIKKKKIKINKIKKTISRLSVSSQLLLC